jgi:benzoate/toluate 1,2-dioxygenase reductase subunit
VEANTDTYSTKLLKRRWLSKKSFEIKLEKPPLFYFQPGQRICLSYGTVERDYSMVSAPEEDDLILCIRHVAEGMLSSQLSTVATGIRFEFTGPHGYFTFQPSSRPAIFIATGTGIAPFCSIASSGVTDITILHGVTLADDLYYNGLLRSAVKRYIPCLSYPDESSGDYFSGRVTDYLQQQLAPRAYDFYLCGRSDMIRDATLLIDERFAGSFIYTEQYF